MQHHANLARTAFAAVVLSLAAAGLAHAQGADPLGVSNIKDAVVATFKVLAALGIVWGFLRMMSGRHTVEGLVTVAVGALGIAKADTITSLLGL
jgi:hypothetical protein